MKKFGIDSLKNKVKELSGKHSPHELSLSLAIGATIAFLPPFGFHTLLAAAIGFVFKLSMPAIIMSSAINNPWTLVPVFFPVYIGEIFIGDKLLHIGFYVPNIPKSLAETKEFFANMQTIFEPLCLGSLVLCAITYIVVYTSSKYIICRYFSERAQNIN